MSVTDPSLTPVSAAMRRQALTTALHRAVANGGRIEREDDFGALVRFGQERSQSADVMHLILILVTFGLWLVVWIPLSIVQTRQRKTLSLTVDEFGNVHEHKL